MTSDAFHPRIQGYLDAVVEACTGDGRRLVSLAVFGSAARGGFSQQMSDVDLLLVLPDDATAADRARAAEWVAALELAHGFRAAEPHGKGALERFIDRAGGNGLSCFVCTRADLLSGEARRIFGLAPAEALFVDRIVLANIAASALTVWGEDLLPRVPVPPVRRLDVLKALFGFASQALFVAAAYPLLPHATKHAMGTLKRSLHSCYFCHHRRAGPLEDEVRFFSALPGADRTLAELLALRAGYRESYGFVLRCLPAVVRLHLRTARGAFATTPPSS